MKKSKLSLCLASSFVAALSLAACNSVSAKDDAVVTIKYGDEEIAVLTDAAYRKYKTESDGVSKFYNAILEALIRYEYADSNSAVRNAQWSKAIKSNLEIKSEAENNVKNDKNTAEENAKTNDTSYETEWDSILKSHNCEDEDDLLEYYIYQLEKEDITDKFFIQQKDSKLVTEWIGINDEGKDAQGSAKGVFPYHIRHVLTSLAGGATNFYDGTITSAEAKNLGNTMAALLDEKYTFADVAKKFSGDSGSGEKGGDVGVMTTTTSFVNEFKLGIYAYDALLSDKSNADIETGLGITNDIEDLEIQVSKDNGKTVKGVTLKQAWTDATYGINGGDIVEVPYDAFLKIGKMAEDEKDSAGKLVNDGDEHYYPRNVLYNFYLNFHNPFVITKKVIYDADQSSADYGFPVSDNSSAYAKRFNEDGYLVDEKGNVIIGVRSEHGIHFMIMEKSIFDFKKSEDTVKGASLEEYYTSSTPNDSSYPTTSKDEKKDTYVNFIETNDNSTYTTRANDIKSSVQSFDSTYDYRLFQYIIGAEGDKIAIADKDLETLITEYISRTQDSNNENAYKTLNDAWRTYTELIERQYENRTEWAPSTEKETNDTFTTISPRCAVGFKNHSGTEWTSTKGICNYEK